MVNLSTTLAGIHLKNPLVLASGVMGNMFSSLQFVAQNGAGAVTLKSIGLEEREGHNNPTIYAWEKGLINAVGLSNPGIENALPFIKKSIQKIPVPVFVSIFANTISGFVELAEKVLPLHPDILELNLSCPNVEDESGRMFALDHDKTAQVVKAVKDSAPDTNVFVKLSPSAFDIASVGKSAEQAGADGITAVNTIPGIIIDTKLRRPILTNKIGGVSGPAIKPIGVRAVYTLYKNISIPIIGMGGINTGEDAIEYMMAGASAVGIGSGIYYRGIDIFTKVTNEIQAFMQEQGYDSIQNIKGAVHTGEIHAD